MDTGPEEESLFLSRVLADLDARRARASEQQALRARVEPAHPAELRALPFRAAGPESAAEERERGGRGLAGPRPCRGYVDPPWPETSQSDFLLDCGQVASLDKPHHLPRYSPSRQGPTPPPREPRLPSCQQKRNDFRKMAALCPQASAFDRRPGPAPFFTRSSEAAYGNPYRAPRRVKHESPDGLQAHRAAAGPPIESPAGSGAPPSDRDSEPSADDISDMFRFLDEMSLCESPGAVASSCYDSAASLGSDSAESWAERGAVRPGRRWRRLDRRLLRSLDGELKASVGQLAAMMGRIENELESLSAARGEMAQVLGKLDKMDRKMRRRDAADGGARQQDAPGSSSWRRSHGGRRLAAAAPPPIFCHHRLTSTDAGPKKAAAAARSPKEDDADIGARSASARSCRRKHAVRHEDTTGRDAGVQAPGRDHRYAVAPAARPPKAAAAHAEERHLPPPPHAAGSPLYSNLRHSCNAERNRAGDGATGVRAEPVSADELAFWLEDVDTPGYDSLLKRREAEFRRAKMCKLAALVGATLGVILVIVVVPVCAMKP